MNLGDRTRMLMEEDARLRAQLQRAHVYAGVDPANKSSAEDFAADMPNVHGVTPRQYQKDMEEWERQQALSYMGDGLSDAMHRNPQPARCMRKERRGKAVGLD